MGHDIIKVMSEGGLQPSDYVHLHNHTHHSLLDGLTKVDELVERVKSTGMHAVAMTDHGTMSGTIEFYKACKAEEIKPIIGIETYVAARTLYDRDPAKDKARYHLILLAMNQQGYENLMKLSTIANLEGYYYKPRIDHNVLEKYNEGLIALSACAGSELGEALRGDDYESAKKTAEWYKSIFGDRYYLEIQDHQEWDVQKKINEGLFRLSKELGIECVVTSDAHYVQPEDTEAHEILLCVGTQSYMSDKNRMSLKDFHLHVTDPAEIIERWGKDHPEIVRNTKVIADRCDIEFEFGKILIPRFPTPDDMSEKEYLDLLVWRGLAWRYAEVSKADQHSLSIEQARRVLSADIIERAEYELGVIENMGFNGYFLIIHDFINWGKSNDIVFGPGRGSAAGSIIAYALNITELDPLTYDLLFERFLNPDRISMPDIDIDIQDTRRDEVIQYCVEKYGPERVANIVTFGKMAARAAVRDVARVLEVPYADADRLAKLIPAPVQGRHIPLAKSITQDPDLKAEYDNNPVSRRVVDFAIRLEGTNRSHGVHAAGVVIAPDDIVKFVPLEMAQKGVVSTQFPMGPVEDLGLLKMDFLGLKNLTVINNCQRIIRKVYNTDVDISELTLDDPKVFELLQRGDTTGVFQLESAGMKKYLRELKPTVFDDIIAMVALYRPGPMQFIDSFIKRKHGQEEITYLHEKMKNALESTYGILVYQEQFMQISKDLSGFTGGQADTLRKAVGKKNMALMQKVRPEFVEGAVKHSGADPEMAEKFWVQLEEFANYCFNKSHAACYAMIAYWTAYLKAHYPDAFMAALMTSDLDDTDRLTIEIAECKHMGLKVLPPDVNESYVEFGVVPGKRQIRFGMAAVKGVGTGAVEEVLRAREDGAFVSIGDFAKRVSTSKFNRKAWESLVKSGGFDSLGDRSDILFNLDTILQYASKLQKEALSGQVDLFGDLGGEVAVPDITIEKAPSPHPLREQLVWERELLGLYLSAHPLDRYDVYFQEQTVPFSQLRPEHDGRQVAVGGVIIAVRSIMTKSGTKMAFVKIEDKVSEGEVIVFPNLFEEKGNLLQQDVVVKIIGKVSGTDRDGNMSGEAKIIADDIVVVTDEEITHYIGTGKKMKAPKAGGGVKVVSRAAKAAPADTVAEAKVARPVSERTLYLQVSDIANVELLTSIKRACMAAPGEDEVILVLGKDKSSAMRMPFRVVVNEALEKIFIDMLGPDAVVIKKLK